jgi:hypothetical protein
MANTYTRDWGSSQPGCMIFLLDQSGSMGDKFGQMQAGSNRRKCDMVATILNSFLNELVTTNTLPRPDGTPDVRNRADICVLGYEGSNVVSALSGGLANRDFVTLSDLQVNPADIEMRKRKDTDDTGIEIEVQVPFPIWVRPKAGGGTPMCAALSRARDLAWQWAMAHPGSYPPVIINVTDGASTDGDPLRVAQEITQVGTDDGQALLFNVHITNLTDSPVAYPLSEGELPNDKYAKSMFSISSVIPETSRALLETLLGGRQVPPGSRGLIFNGDATSVRLMFNFASKPRTQPLDPNM